MYLRDGAPSCERRLPTAAGGPKEPSCRQEERGQSGHLWHDQRARTSARAPRPRRLSIDGEDAQLQPGPGASSPVHAQGCRRSDQPRGKRICPVISGAHGSMSLSPPCHVPRETSEDAVVRSWTIVAGQSMSLSQQATRWDTSMRTVNPSAYAYSRSNPLPATLVRGCFSLAACTAEGVAERHESLEQFA